MTCQSIVKVYLPKHHPFWYQHLAPHHAYDCHSSPLSHNTIECKWWKIFTPHLHNIYISNWYTVLSTQQKCEMTYIISMLFSFVSSSPFLVLVNTFTFCACKTICTTTNLPVVIVIALIIKDHTTCLTTPFLKRCYMWWTW